MVQSLFKSFVFSALTCGVFFYVQSSSAQVAHKCQYSDAGAGVSIQAGFTMFSGETVRVSSTLIYNGTEIPALSEYCSPRHIPGRNGFLCSHRIASGQTFDLYPNFDADGALKGASLLVWREDGIEDIQFVDCK
jgi:hypothetical protein